MKRYMPVAVLLLVLSFALGAAAQSTNEPIARVLTDPIALLLKGDNSDNYVRCEVDERGHVVKVLDTNISKKLRSDYVAVAMTWQFNPYLVNGQPVRFVVDVWRTYRWQTSTPTIKLLRIVR